MESAKQFTQSHCFRTQDSSAFCQNHPSLSPTPEWNQSPSPQLPWIDIKAHAARFYPFARAHHIAGDNMLKFIGGTVGVIFLIGLIVVVLLLKLIF
jgi:hypothetical protein